LPGPVRTGLGEEKKVTSTTRLSGKKGEKGLKGFVWGRGKKKKGETDRGNENSCALKMGGNKTVKNWATSVGEKKPKDHQKSSRQGGSRGPPLMD